MNIKINIKKHLKKIIFIVLAIIILAGVFFLGAYTGYSNRPEVEKVISVVSKEPQVQPQTPADFSPFWKAWNILNKKSIYAKKVSDQDRVWGAIKGMTSSLGDPYTVFFPPEENKLFNDEIQGSFDGIGAEIGIKDKTLIIISPLKDSPSWKAGLKAGDKIIKIDSSLTTDITVEKALTLIRGAHGTVVTLTVLRDGEKETREIKVTRDKIDVPVIDTELRADNIFVIKFYSFSQNSADLFKDALKKFIDSGSHKLVLDMRGNPGGYLDAAVNIGSWFIDEGKVIVSEDFEGNDKTINYRSHGPRIFTDKLQFIVLVDGGSASAAEILAGALQEYGVATLVGTKTFGKGSVQELIDITDKTSLKVTVAKWLTPNGKSISLQGLEPDIKVPFTQKDADTDNDPQMNKAVEILQAKQ